MERGVVAAVEWICGRHEQQAENAQAHDVRPLQPKAARGEVDVEDRGNGDLRMNPVAAVFASKQLDSFCNPSLNNLQKEDSL